MAGLNKGLDEVRNQILGRKPLSALQEVFSKVRREESRRSIMMNLESPRTRIIFDSFALITKEFDQGEKWNSKKR